MKRFKIFSSLSIIILSLQLSNAQNTIENLGNTDYYYIMKCNGNSYRKIASPFTTPNAIIRITQVQVYSYEAQSGFKVFARIMTNNNGSPSNTIVTNGTSNSTAVSSANSWITMTYNSNSLPVLSPNTTYFLVIAGDASSTSNACRFYTNNNLGNSSKWSTTSSCTSEVWVNPSTNGDIVYKIFYEIVQPTVSIHNTGSSNQINFNNSYINSSNPIFRLSGTHTSEFNRFQIEINTSADFTGTSYTQTFSGTYSSNTQYDLVCNSLSPALPTTNNITYYVRARASDDEGTNWGTWSNETFCFTYKNSGDPEWMQTTTEQFNTNILNNTTANSNIVEIVSNNYGTTSIGSNSDHTGGWFTAKKVVIPHDIILQSLSIYFSSTVNNSRFTMALYAADGTGGTPRTRLAVTNEVNITGTAAAWYNIPTTSNPTISAGTYYIAINSTSASNQIRYNSASSTEAYAKSYTYSHPLPDPAPTGLTSYSRNYSLYLTGYPSEGTVQSTPIYFSSFIGANSWNEITWDETETYGNVKIQVLYNNSGTPTLIPDTDISGNSSGIASSPIIITSLNTSTYNTIYLKSILTYDGGSPTLNSWKVSCVFGTDYDAEAQEPNSQVTSTTISSVNNVTYTTAKEVFKFKITDLGSSDNKSTFVSKIRIKPGPNNNSNWSSHIQGVKLYNHNTSNWINISSATITDSYIDININSGNLEISDASSTEISLYVYLNTSNITDNGILQFSISSTEHGMQAYDNGTQFANIFNSNITGNNINIVVEAEKLLFAANFPPSIIAKNTSFEAKVYAVDTYNNLDLDYSSGNITLIVYNGSGNLSSSSGLTKNITNGIALWTNLLYDSLEDCNPDGLKIKAQHSGILNEAFSNCINVIDPPGNFIITTENSEGCAGSNISIIWQSASNADSYDLHWCNTPGCNPQNSTNIIENVSSPYNFTITENNSIYQFRIKANNTATSTWSSNVLSFMTYNQNTWKGSVNSNWYNAANWCGNSVPECTDDVFILAGAQYNPVLDNNVSVKSIYIQQGGNLNLNNYTLKIYGDASIEDGTITASSGNIEFAKSGCSESGGIHIFDPGNNYYNNIIISSDIVQLINNDLKINGNLTINTGEFKANNKNIEIKGNWSNYSIFNPGTGSVIFTGNTNSTILKNGPLVTIYKTGFEDFDGGTAGWKLGSVPGKTEWRRQSGAIPGQRLASAQGNYDLNVYSLLNNKPGYAFDGTLNHNSYVDAQKKIDLTDVNSANISFKWYCHGNGTYAFTGVLLADGAEIVNNLFTSSIPSSWQNANYSLNSFCNKETIITFRMFLISYGSFPTSPGNYGFAIDDIEIKGNESSENFNKLIIDKSNGASVNINSLSNIIVYSDLEIKNGNFNTNNRRIKAYGNIINNGNIVSEINGEIVLKGENTQIIKGSSSLNIAKLKKNSLGNLIIGDENIDNFTLNVTNSFEWIDNNDIIKIGNGKKAKFIVPGDFKINGGCTIETDFESTLEIKGHYINYGTYVFNDGEILFTGDKDSYIIKEPTQVIYYEGFEESDGGFTLGTGPSSWARCSGNAHNSNYDLAIKATAQNVPYDYLYNSASNVSATKTIDLTGYETAMLQFWWRCAGVSGEDYGQLLINNNIIMDNIHGSPIYVQSERIDISQYANGVITLTFRWINNNSGGSSPGLCIDDILITGSSVNMETFYNLSVDKSNNKSTLLKCPIDVNNNVTITNGKLNSSGIDFTVGGNWYNYNSSEFIANNNTVTFDGNNEDKNQLIYNNSLNKFHNISILNAGNHINLENNRLYLTGDIKIIAGELKANTQDIMIEGDWINSGGIFDASNKTVYFRGQNDQQIFTNSHPFYNLSLPKQNIPNIGYPQKLNKLFINEDILINNNLILSSGEFNNNGFNIEIKGNWYNEGGIFFHPNNSTTKVKFSGNNIQTFNLKTDESVYEQNFSFDDVEIDGNEVRFHIKTNDLLLYLRNLKINDGKTLKIIQE